MLSRIAKYLLLTCILLINGCDKKKVNKNVDGGIKKTVNNGFEIEMIPYKKAISKEDEISNKYICFILRITPVEPSAYNLLFNSKNRINLLKKLSFGMSENIYINQDGNLVKAEKCIYSETYNTTPYKDILIYFDKNKLSYEELEKIDISVLEFGLGTEDLRFQFTESDIEK
jgi:hypothetical protein